MCVNETYSTVRIGKNLSHKFLTQNCLEQGDTLSPLLFSFTSKYAIGTVKEDGKGLQLNGAGKLLASADDVSIVGQKYK
jgi:hypothetical protein